MIRSMSSLRVAGAYWRGLCSAAAQPTKDVDVFEGLVTEVKNQKIAPDTTHSGTPSIATLSQLNKFVSEGDSMTVASLTDVLNAAFAFKVQKGKALDMASRSFARVPSSDLSNVSVSESMTLMALLLRLNLHDSQFFKDLEQSWNAASSPDSVDLSVVLPFLYAANENNYQFNAKMTKDLQTIVDKQIESIDRTSDLLTLLSHYRSSPDRAWLFVAATRARTLLPIMSLAEQVSLLRCFAQHGHRDSHLLPLLTQKVVEAKSALTLKQIVSIAASCSGLNFFDARMLRRLATDLKVNVNHLTSWNDATSLINSFSRLRIGDAEVSGILTTWVNGHLDSAPFRSLSVAVAGMARLGIEEGREAARVLAQQAKRQNVPHEKVWLNLIHSLAYFDQLTMELAETALNKDFVAQLMQSSRSLEEKMYNVMKVLQIQACVKMSFADNYKGPVVDRKSFGFDLDSQEAVDAAFKCKFGGKNMESCRDMLLKDGLLKIAPSTHIGSSYVDDVGCLCESRVVLDENNRLVAQGVWKEQVPRPVILFNWSQLHQRLNVSPADLESTLLGPDRMSLRLLRNSNRNPIVVFDSRLLSCSTQADKVTYLTQLLTSK